MPYRPIQPLGGAGRAGAEAPGAAASPRSATGFTAPNKPVASAAPASSAVTPMAFVQAIALAYERRGLSPARALAQAQIAPSVLHDKTARITAWQMERLSGAAMLELDDEAPALGAPTLGVALKRWRRHHGLIADDIALRLSVSGDTALVTIDERALQQMLQRALPLTVLPYRRDRLLVQRVRQALAAHPAQTHSAGALAALLHVSARTLHRQLKEEGASLQQLKDEVRRGRSSRWPRRRGLRTRKSSSAPFAAGPASRPANSGRARALLAPHPRVIPTKAGMTKVAVLRKS